MNRLNLKHIVVVVSLLGLAGAALAGPRIGEPAPDFAATDIGGKMIKLSDLKGKIVVLESHRSLECPFCEAQYKSGAMQDLQRECTSNGVVWLQIDFDTRPMGPTPEKARKEWTDRKMAVTDMIIDTEGSQIGRRYGFISAPEAFVIDKDGVLAYQGAIDGFAEYCRNSPVFRATLVPPGKMPLAQVLAARDQAITSLDPRNTRNYVREAVQALLAGQRPQVTQVRPYGCPVAFAFH